MVNFKDMSAEQLLEQPPSYDTMVKTIQSRVKAKVKRAMPRIRGKVAALGKAKVKEKKKVAKKIAKTAETATAIRKRAQLEVRAMTGHGEYPEKIHMAKAGMIDKDTTVGELRLLSKAYKGFGFTFADLLNLSEQIQKGKKKPISLEKLLYPKGLSPRDRREGVVIGEQRLARDKLIRAENKKRKKEGKKEIIKGIKKIGATELAKKKAAGARISVKAKMPSIQAKVAELGKAKVAEKKKVGKEIKKVVKERKRVVKAAKKMPKKQKKRGQFYIDAVESGRGRIASRRREFGGIAFQDKLAIDYANFYDAKTESVFIDTLTDTVVNPVSGNVIGTMYGSKFQKRGSPWSQFSPSVYDETREALASELGAQQAVSRESSVDTDTDSELEVDVEEITIDGKIYYLDDSNGYIYDPDTSERVPRQIELDYYNR